MADYKDIITGTLSSLVGKVKEVAESGSVRNIYEQGSNRAKAYGRIAKLTLEMNGDNEELRRVYTEIGKLYYEQAKDAPEGFFAPLFTQAEQITAQILAREDEINTLKASFDGSAEDADIEVEVSEFDDVVDATQDDGADAKSADKPDDAKGE
ncbi:MAG: hypothetical protein VB039_06280 [Oscillospiraceae bacterium]|nr:hypothetical protein [Oscillospiraceae bacterium]